MSSNTDPAPSSLRLASGASEEAAALLGLWGARWPGVETWRHCPREARPNDWVRFHTLPDGRRQIRHRRDRRTVVRRFRRVLRAVEQLTGHPGRVLLVEDPTWPGELHDRVRSVVPQLQPWVTHVMDDMLWTNFDAGDDEYEEDADKPVPSHSFRRGPVDDRLVADLVLLVHEREADFLLLPDDLSWAIGAYDGGLDVVLRNEEEAAALAQRLGRWLPPAGWPGLGGWKRPATQRELHRGLDS